MSGSEKEIQSASALFMEEADAPLRLSLRGRKLTIAIAFVTGAGFTLFGYEGPHVQKSQPLK